MPGAVWATDRDLRLTYVQGGTSSLAVASSEELIGKTIYEFVGGTGPTEPLVAHHLAALTGSSQSFQYFRRERWFDVLLEPLRDDGGAVVGCVGAAIDITDRRAVQDRLALTETRLAEVQRVAHVGSFEWDAGTNLVTSSEELQRIYGVADEPPATLEAFLARAHHDDEARVRTVFFDAVQHGKPFVGDFRIVRSDGEIRMLRAAGDAVAGAAGRPARVIGSCWDITVLHDTTRKLERSVSLLEATLDATADGILVVDRDGKIATHNQRFADMWRIPPTLARRGDDRALLSYVSEQLEDPQAFENGVRDLYASPERESSDVLHFQDGRVFERQSMPQTIGGTIVGRVWSFRDVTEREGLLHKATFMADATRLLASLDIEQALRAVAHLAVPYLGERCAIDLIRDGQPDRLATVPAGDAAEPLPSLHPTVLAGYSSIYSSGGRSHVAVPLVSRDRVVGVISFAAAPSRSYARGDLELVEALGRRAALALDNARLYEGARDALASRDEFLSIAAHEIRGPLTSIHLAAQGILRESLPPESLRTALDVIQREDRRLARFVDDLLDLGRIRTGQLHFDLEDVDVGSVVRDVVSRLTSDATHAGSTVSVTTSGDLTGQWDRVRLDQVVTNLLSNAIKFGQGKPIAIDATRTGERIQVRVADHGIGIDQAMLATIFDPFERAVGTRNYGGLGLGLHIAKTIVEGLGGTLTVNSRPGTGATFTVELPASGGAQHGATADSGRG